MHTASRICKTTQLAMVVDERAGISIRKRAFRRWRSVSPSFPRPPPGRSYVNPCSHLSSKNHYGYVVCLNHPQAPLVALLPGWRHYPRGHHRHARHLSSAMLLCFRIVLDAVPRPPLAPCAPLAGLSHNAIVATNRLKRCGRDVRRRAGSQVGGRRARSGGTSEDII